MDIDVVRSRRRLAALAAVASLTMGSSPLTVAAQQRQVALPDWTVGAEPTLALGNEGSAASDFLRISAVFRLPSGRIAVVNGATSEIRFFDSNGKFFRTFGRMGSGPGEFRNIGWVGRQHDTLFAMDHGAQRITTLVVDSVPRLVRSVQLTAQGKRGHYFVNGRFGDGRWLVHTGSSPRWDGPPGVHRLPAWTGWIPAAGDGEVVWIAERRDLAVFVHNPTGDIKQAIIGAAAFSPAYFAVASGPFVWLADSDSDSLEQINVGSSSRRAVRLPFPAVRPSRALAAAARAREESRMRGGAPKGFQDEKYGSKLPQFLPRFEQLVLGPDGELWVQQYASDRSEATRYLVLDPELRPLAWVRVAAGFRVMELGHDYVLGVHEDGDGLETVRMYRLTRR
jgi:hypothetical protein